MEHIAVTSATEKPVTILTWFVLHQSSCYYVLRGSRQCGQVGSVAETKLLVGPGFSVSVRAWNWQKFQAKFGLETYFLSQVHKNTIEIF